ncbi:hypothetical protein [Globicatella sp. PHS-GS-PNBC-21-1553]|nr:hypothetical protein [Globicatella sp. PHS-GS-PNBC-21-1553]
MIDLKERQDSLFGSWSKEEEMVKVEQDRLKELCDKNKGEKI